MVWVCQWCKFNILCFVPTQLQLKDESKTVTLVCADFNATSTSASKLRNKNEIKRYDQSCLTTSANLILNNKPQYIHIIYSDLSKRVCAHMNQSRNMWMHRYHLEFNKQQCVWMFYLFVEPEVIVLVLAGVITQITQIASPSELQNRISECQGSHSIPPSPIGCGVVVLMSEAEGLPWRWAPRWHFKRTAHGRLKQSISNGWESGGSRSRDQDRGSQSHQEEKR